jgi:transposase-like protein
MEQALGAVFPATTLQTCIVHLIRSSLDYAGWKDRKALAQALRPIYAAANAEAALTALQEFEAAPFGQRYPSVAAGWRRAWAQVIPSSAFPPAVRKVIYTTDEINKPFLYLATSRRRYCSSTRSVLRTSTHVTSPDSSYSEVFLGAAA